MKNAEAKRTKHPGGRPRKFAEPSRPITVTLPQSILQALEAVNTDRAKAIVKCVEAATAPLNPSNGKSITITEVSPGVGLIVMGPCATLRKIPWLRMSEIAPLRYILSVQSGVSVESLEIALSDVLETLSPREQHERETIRELRDFVQSIRRGQRVTKAEILFVRTNPANFRPGPALK